MQPSAPTAPSPHPNLHSLIISAPFGNYIQPAGATPTLGTFTAQPRRGRWWQTLRTVRYYPRLGAWVNRIGLRNPGIDWLARRAAAGKIDLSDKIVSIHGFSSDHWTMLLDTSTRLAPLAIELNMSCPNVGQIDWPTDLFERAVSTELPVIVKLPPINYEQILDGALDAGARILHCCNTLPIPAGGLSGKPLKPLSLQCIVRSRQIARDRGIEGLSIIGGGGITTPVDIDHYADAGADRVAVGTKAMNPLRLLSDGPLRGLIGHADRVLPRPTSRPGP